MEGVTMFSYENYFMVRPQDFGGVYFVVGGGGDGKTIAIIHDQLVEIPGNRVKAIQEEYKMFNTFH